jgi:hypothetical protein
MLARDVLTVHQRRYYESGGEQWPGDFDDPNPVSFLTVAPGGCFRVALELAPGAKGGRALLERAGRYLTEALKEWGLGGKPTKQAGLPTCPSAAAVMYSIRPDGSTTIVCIGSTPGRSTAAPPVSISRTGRHAFAV